MSNEITVKKTTSVDFGPKNFTELQTFAQIITKTGMCPREYRDKPNEAIAVIMFGSELGLSPLQSLNDIKCINGKPTPYGDGLLAIVLAHPACMGIEETMINPTGNIDDMGYSCTVHRRGHKPHTVVFTVKNAKKAGLWGKSGPWVTYPARMLQMRARGFALRDKFADALKGMISYEEASDYPIVGSASTNTPVDLDFSTAEKNLQEEFKAQVPVASIIDEETGEIFDEDYTNEDDAK